MIVNIKDWLEKRVFFSYCGNFTFLILFSLSLCLPAMLQTVLGITSAYGQTAKIDDGERQWPHENSDLKPDQALTFANLPNGFRYVMMNNHNPKGRVSMHLDVQIGSLNEREAERGLAHFLEHMQFNGSTNFKPGELVKYFQRIGMQFGPDANAHTSFDETVYDIFLPSGDIKHISDGLLVMRDFADGALLLKSEIDKERKVVLAEMRSRDSADYRTLEASLKFEFPEALLSQRLPIGKKETLKNADQDLIKAFYQTWYRPENMILVIVGEFDQEKVHSAVKKYFGDMQAELPPKNKPDFGKINHSGIKSFYHYEKESGNTNVSIGNVIEIEPESDSLLLQKKMMTRHLADLIFQNRIDTLLEDPEAPFTSAEAGTGQFLHKVQYAQISAETNPSNWKESLIQIERLLRAALIYGFQPAELERVKNDFLSKLNNEVKTASTRNSKELSQQIIRNLNADRVFQSPQQEKEIYGSMLEKITIEDINRAFRSVWSAKHRLLSVTGNADLKKESEDPRATIKNAYNLSLASAVKPPKKLSRSKFPYLTKPETMGEIVSRKTISDLNIEQINFANGLRLNLKKTDFKRNQVSVNLAFGHGQSAEPMGLAGISELAQSVVNESGLGRLTADELKAALAGKVSRVSFAIQEENFLLSGFTAPDELKLLFQLIHAHLVDPGFRDSAYRLSLKRFKQRDQAMTKSVDGVMGMSGERFLAGGDSRFGVASFDEIKKISLQDIEKWVRSEFATTPLEVSIVGDFNPQEAVELVSLYLGSLAFDASSDRVERSNKISFPENKKNILTVDSRIPKSLVVVAYLSDDFWDIGQTRRLSALADLFSERLRVYIREEQGVAYSPFAYNQGFTAYPGYGLLRAQITTDPLKAESVAEEVKDIAQQIFSGPITEDELKRIKDPITNSIKDLRRTNRYWLNSVLTLSSRHPQKLEWSRTIESDYRAITAKELSVLAKKYLREDLAATVIVTPEINSDL